MLQAIDTSTTRRTDSVRWRRAGDGQPAGDSRGILARRESKSTLRWVMEVTDSSIKATESELSSLRKTLSQCWFTFQYERGLSPWLEEMLAGLPTACNSGVQRKATGHRESQNERKLQIDAIDGACR